MTIKNLAGQIASDAYPDVYQIDPATILLVITIIKGVIGAIQKCREENDNPNRFTSDVSAITYVVNRPSAADKRTMKRIVRRKMGWWKYWWEGKQVCESLFKSGRTMDRKTVRKVLIDIEMEEDN